MEVYYLDILHAHIAAVSLSGCLFLVRAIAGNVFGVRWIMSASVRYASHAIDTVLLTAALMLMTITHQFPFVNAWLTVKVIALVGYVVLGSFALKRAKTRPARLAYSAAAAAVFLFIVSIALTHNPLGVISLAT